MSTTVPDYWVAAIDFEFGGVKVRKGQPIPCHRKPWSTLLDFGGRYEASLPLAGRRDGPLRVPALRLAAPLDHHP